MSGGTELIRDFVNTRDILDDVDVLATPAALAEWCVSRYLVPDASVATAGDLRQALELREALRQLLLGNNGIEINHAGALEVLDRVACRAGVGLRCREGAVALVPAAEGIKGALGSIVASVHDSMADGSWARLKACRAGDCEWAFVDDAKNRSRAWCSMSSCGNREKARAFRERQRSGSSSSR